MDYMDLLSAVQERPLKLITQLASNIRKVDVLGTAILQQRAFHKMNGKFSHNYSTFPLQTHIKFWVFTITLLRHEVCMLALFPASICLEKTLHLEAFTSQARLSIWGLDYSRKIRSIAYICIFYDVITHPCPNINGGLSKWIITSHRKPRMYLLIHVLMPALRLWNIPSNL